LAISASKLSPRARRALAKKGIHLPAGGHKYRARRCWYDPQTRMVFTEKRLAPKGALYFDSASELAHWQNLEMLERKGHIAALRRQVKYPLCAPRLYGGAAVITHYIADFQYLDVATGHTVVEDRKSVATKTEVYKLKKKWLEVQFGILVREV
jgi:hypothetical protein